jgi:hypothetical protein
MAELHFADSCTRWQHQLKASVCYRVSEKCLIGSTHWVTFLLPPLHLKCNFFAVVLCHKMRLICVHVRNSFFKTLFLLGHLRSVCSCPLHTRFTCNYITNWRAHKTHATHRIPISNIDQLRLMFMSHIPVPLCLHPYNNILDPATLFE